MNWPVLIGIIAAVLINVFIFYGVTTTQDRFYVHWSIKNEPEYVEYETAELINKIWHDPEAIGECQTCGLDDLPVICTDWLHGKQECKWCRELANLTYHLSNHGVRRFKKVS